MVVQGMWAHLHSLYDTTAHTEHADAEVLVRLLRSLGTTAVADCVDADLLAKLVRGLLDRGLHELSDKDRMIALLALSQLSRKGGLREHREVEARLHDGMWGMWGTQADGQETQEDEGLATLFEDGPGRVHLAILLSALPLGSVRGEASARGLVAVGDEIADRNFLELLSPPALRGLLVGLVHAHSHLPPALSVDEKGAWGLLPPLMAEIVRHQRAQCFVIPSTVRATSKLRFFLGTVKSPAFQHTLAHLYRTRVGVSRLRVAEIADLLELLSRWRRSGDQGLDADFCHEVKQALLRHDPMLVGIATSHRLREALLNLPEVLPSADYLRQLTPSHAQRRQQSSSSMKEPLAATSLEEQEKKRRLLEDTKNYLMHINKSPWPVSITTPRPTIVKQPRRKKD